MLKDLYADEEGLAAVEYSLLVVILVAGLILTWRSFSCELRTVVWRSSNAFDRASTTGP